MVGSDPLDPPLLLLLLLLDEEDDDELFGGVIVRVLSSPGGLGSLPEPTE